MLCVCVCMNVWVCDLQCKVCNLWGWIPSQTGPKKIIMITKDNPFIVCEIATASQVSECSYYWASVTYLFSRSFWILCFICAGSPNNSNKHQPAMDVTAKAIYERLVLVSGWQSETKSTTVPSAPTPPPLTQRLSLHLLFWLKNFPEWAPKTLVSTVPVVI